MEMDKHDIYESWYRDGWNDALDKLFEELNDTFQFRGDMYTLKQIIEKTKRK